MRHEFLVLTVKKLLKSVSIYGSYRKNKTGVPLFLDHPGVYTVRVVMTIGTTRTNRVDILLTSNAKIENNLLILL